MLSKLYRSLVMLYRRNTGLKAHSVVLGKNVWIDRDSSLEGGNRIYENCSIHNSDIGYGTYIQRDAIIHKTRIGRFCSIGPNFQIVVGTHPTAGFVSTHPAFYSTLKQAGFTYVANQRFKEINLTRTGYLVDIGSDVEL